MLVKRSNLKHIEGFQHSQQPYVMTRKRRTHQYQGELGTRAALQVEYIFTFLSHHLSSSASHSQPSSRLQYSENYSYHNSKSKIQRYTETIRLQTQNHSPRLNMQLNNIIVLALSASAYANNVASGVSCWKSGPSVSVSNISPHITTICDYMAGAAYVPKEERNQCVQDDAGVMWNFALTVGKITNFASFFIREFAL